MMIGLVLLLRSLALLFGGALPLLLLVLSMAAGGTAQSATLVAALSGLFGIVIERWLFFAEAKHTVSLYYGDRLA